VWLSQPSSSRWAIKARSSGNPGMGSMDMPGPSDSTACWQR
jgi:hypothetical protein